MTKAITRRSLLAVAAALPAAAQQPVTPVPSTPGEEASAAQSRLTSAFEELRKVRLPISTEPVTQFRA